MDRRDRKLKRIINLINVNGHTRAKIRGTLIFCPHCKSTSRVYHFAWCATICQSCRREVQKKEFLIEAKK